MKATKEQVLEKAAQVVEAHIARLLAYQAGDDTNRYDDVLTTAIHMLKWTIERDRPGMIKRFKDAHKLESSNV